MKFGTNSRSRRRAIGMWLVKGPDYSHSYLSCFQHGGIGQRQWGKRGHGNKLGIPLSSPGRPVKKIENSLHLAELGSPHGLCPCSGLCPLTPAAVHGTRTLHHRIHDLRSPCHPVTGQGVHARRQDVDDLERFGKFGHEAIHHVGRSGA